MASLATRRSGPCGNFEIMQTVGAASLDAILFDFDGVLTDNRIIVLQDGSEGVICNRADGLAFDFLKRAGMPALIVSTETNPVVAARAAKLGIETLTEIGDKSAAINALCAQRGYKPERLMFVGNDVNDLPAMALAGYPVAVADAHGAVLKAAWRVLKTPGGAGVAREIVEHVVRFDQSFY